MNGTISSNQLDLSVIIPAYLEEENLRILLPRVLRTLSSLVQGHEVLVVDTVNPLDQTRMVCEECQAVYLNCQDDDGFGNAVRTGISNARGKHIIFMDADGSHSPEFIKELYVHADNYDVVIASRYIEGGKTEDNPLLVLMSRILNLSYSLVLNLPCADVSTSFKLYRADQLKSLELECTKFDIIEEILFKLRNRYDVKIKEVPFTFRKRMFGRTKRNLLLLIFTYIFSLVRLRMMK